MIKQAHCDKGRLVWRPKTFKNAQRYHHLEHWQGDTLIITTEWRDWPTAKRYAKAAFGASQWVPA